MNKDRLRELTQRLRVPEALLSFHLYLVSPEGGPGDGGKIELIASVRDYNDAVILADEHAERFEACVVLFILSGTKITAVLNGKLPIS